MTKEKFTKIDTLCAQAGYNPQNGESRIPPIVQSTTFKYDSTDTVAKLFDLEESGFFYTRLGNPTNDALEKKTAALDGGIAAVSTSSGQSANLLAVLNIARSGDNIVAINNIYGGTFNLLATTIKNFGIETKFVNSNDLEELEKNIDKNTKLIFGETLSNPRADVIDIEAYAKIAHKNNIPLILDNSLATPALVKPIDFGCDIVTYSSSKYLDGHAAAMGGIIVDSGKFDWTKGNFPYLNEADESYHGLIYTKHFGNVAYAARIRTVGLRDLGAILSPFNAYLTYLGLDTLSLRLKKTSDNALEVAKFLEESNKVESVNYAYLPSSKDYELSQKYLNGGGGVISFEIKGGREKAKKFIENLELLTLCVHVSDVRSYALHPASSTHRQLSDEQLKEVGISPSLIRLSIGIEDIEDILKDIENALNA
ncbi:O-acetylhomoserine aminocarboxypropyltransferase/cysteine synthase family protein [Anaerococcus porci]|uniref:O-acetylhomoserine aminocarboxypropyltransferase/cysteine synthase n=1 Tax=Anaerococcus porci TaxID=2652269 RepID=A0A6N7VGL5_9FIRM|nr:O-acetylhomoserine aminocarboxypropyltransferase/cysteine synthase family protein [Anaerococcus porci]MDY3005904.1 O-acetylhomoserine aminocarboxypropyltransferase/cysteine synthase family protein [Anaerococcus porci]MSS78031.1 O-acetylhomoserine aminocarboxypropyltransferase/cysteine synthase [Anaerococcus porci]